MPYLILIALTIVGWGVGSVFYKVAIDNTHPIMVSLIVTAVYLVLEPFVFLVAKFPKNINMPGATYAVLAGIFMAIGSLAYFFALKKADVGIVTSTVALYPALTLGISILFLGEQISFKQCIGVVLAMTSFFFLSQK